MRRHLTSCLPQFKTRQIHSKYLWFKSLLCFSMKMSSSTYHNIDKIKAQSKHWSYKISKHVCMIPSLGLVLLEFSSHSFSDNRASPHNLDIQSSNQATFISLPSTDTSASLLAELFSILSWRFCNGIWPNQLLGKIQALSEIFWWSLVLIITSVSDALSWGFSAAWSMWADILTCPLPWARCRFRGGAGGVDPAPKRFP